MTALAAFGFGAVGLTENDFKYPDKVNQPGVPPVRVDINYRSLLKDAFSGCAEGKYGDVSVKYIGLREFIENKK